MNPMINIPLASFTLPWLGLALAGGLAAAPKDGAALDFTLEKPGFVTLAIEDANGQRVRNLMAAQWREAGPQRERWDGLSDAGEPLAPGRYHWKGITRDAITAHFEATFNSPGNPPWNTAKIAAQRYVRASGDGGWLSDHERPVCAFADDAHIYFGAEIAEAGHAIMELDPQGRKSWGTLWLGLSGASAIASRAGVLYVAGEKGWMKDSLAVHRLDARTHLLLPNPAGSEVPPSETAFIKVSSANFAEIKGMVVTSQWIVLALADRNRLACFDLSSGKFLKDIALPGAGAIVPTRDGGLLAISNTKVVRLDLTTGHSQTLIDGPLTKPLGLAVSATGNILVSDCGAADPCVKTFSPDGQPLGRIGTPGGRREGRFDPQAMTDPRALTVDAKDQVWVGEYSYLPKRISVWTLDGKLVRDWMGPPFYGGGGALDPQNPARAFYKGMAFEVAPWPEPSTLKAILFRPEDHQDLPYPTLTQTRVNGVNREHEFYAKLPQAPVYRGKRLYLLNDEGYGVEAILIGEVVADHLVPRVVFGSVKVLRNAWLTRHPEYVNSLAAGAAGVFLWQDLNGDGTAEPAEVQIEPTWKFGALWAMRAWPALNLYAQAADGTRIMEVAPLAASGDLRYQLALARPIPVPAEWVKRGITALAPDLQGNLIVNLGGGGQQGDKANPLVSLSPNGKINWSYPNPYPGNWHNSPRPQPGDIQHTLNVEGVAALGGAIGNVFQLNGNKGVRYLFTTDGLFISQLYGDMRGSPAFKNCNEVSSGLRVDGYSLEDECFSGWFGMTPDRRVLQVVGKDSSNIMQVRGLETLQRLSGGTLNLTHAAVAGKAAKAFAAPPLTTIQLSGIPTGWEELGKHPLSEEVPHASFALGYQASGLRLVMTLAQAKAFANAGDDPKTLFKTGDAVDLLLAAAPAAPLSRTTAAPGDLRIVFSLWKGKPVAVRYRFVVPNSDAAHHAKFASPTGVAVVDEVSLLPTVDVRIETAAGGWRLTANIPWKELGLDQAPTASLRGDVGLILADPSGTRSVARHYYFDRGSQVVSDLPSEVRVNPAKWGEIRF